MRESFEVDLRDWITSEHGATRQRFEHAIAGPVPLSHWREQAGGDGASIAWLLLHSAYHEDLAVQTVVDGRPPLLEAWRARLGLAAHAPHDGLGEHEDRSVTLAVDLDGLRAYADEVHAATAAWLGSSDLAGFDDPADGLGPLAELSGVTEDAVPWLYGLWRDKPVGWFVQWEAIGHVQGHLGEMVSVRGRLGLSPF